jgi:transposase InsO family protein
VDRSSVRYRSVHPDDGETPAAMKAVAAKRRRFGYRRIHVMLERQGVVMNLGKLRRICREEKLGVRRSGGRKRALGTRRPMLLPDAANIRWSLDFVRDALTGGRRFQVLTVVDDYRSECLFPWFVCFAAHHVTKGSAPKRDRSAPMMIRGFSMLRAKASERADITIVSDFPEPCLFQVAPRLRVPLTSLCLPWQRLVRTNLPAPPRSTQANVRSTFPERHHRDAWLARRSHLLRYLRGHGALAGESVALSAGRTVELEGRLRAQDGYLAAEQTPFGGAKSG